MQRLLHTLLILGALVIAIAGCRNAASQAPARAETVVQNALDAWARGESADKYADGKQPFQVIDPDWKAGNRLTSFMIVEAKASTEKPDQVMCRVSLSQIIGNGQAIDKDVTYHVKLGAKTLIERSSQP
jgi:hypothetical protein